MEEPKGGEPRVLLTGIDGLDALAYGDLAVSPLRLHDWKTQAQATRGPLIVNLAKEPVRVLPKGWPGFPFVLEHDRGLLGINPDVGRSNRAPARGRISLDHVARDWMASRAGVAARTRDTEAWHYRRWVAPTFGKRHVANITTADIARWLGDMATRDAAPSTTRRALAVLRGILTHAIADRRIAVSPALPVRAPRGGARREGKALTVRELERLLGELPPGFVVPVACLALSGLRFSEWAALTVGDVVVTPHGSAFRIHRAMPQDRSTNRLVVGDTKGHRSRAVPIPASVSEHLRERIDSADRTAPLFPTPTGLHWTNTNFRARSDWTGAVQRAGLPGLRIHDLRHTAATLMLGSGADLKSVSRILGHASTVMTADLYGHVIDSHVFEASAKLPGIDLSATGYGSDSTNGLGS